MQLSLAICTRNRASQLAESLRSLTRLRYSDPWELVIVDNGSRDETQAVIKNFKESLPLKSVIEPQTGLARSRNRALAVSRGEIIAFTDDDCYPAPDFLSLVLRCFQEDPRFGFIGGRVLLYDPSDYHSTIQEKESRQGLAPGDFFPTGLIHGANFAFRRTALKSVNGFDERFGAGGLFGCAEDAEILARMLAGGWSGAYDPRPLVYHHHGRKTRKQAVRLKRGYDKGRGAYYAKCLLNPKLRAVYLESWYRTLKGKTIGAMLRELSGAGEFLGWATLSSIIPGLHKGQGAPAIQTSSTEPIPLPQAKAPARLPYFLSRLK